MNININTLYQFIHIVYMNIKIHTYILQYIYMVIIYIWYSFIIIKRPSTSVKSSNTDTSRRTTFIPNTRSQGPSN